MIFPSPNSLESSLDELLFGEEGSLLLVGDGGTYGGSS